MNKYNSIFKKVFEFDLRDNFKKHLDELELSEKEWNILWETNKFPPSKILQLLVTKKCNETIKFLVFIGGGYYFSYKEPQQKDENYHNLIINAHHTLSDFSKQVFVSIDEQSENGEDFSELEYKQTKEHFQQHIIVLETLQGKIELSYEKRANLNHKVWSGHNFINP